MQYRAVIFDLDGVVCSTDEYHYLAWKSIADELGIDFTPQVNNRLRGLSRMDSLEVLLEGYGGVMTAADKQYWADRKNNLYIQNLENLSPDDVFPGFLPTLAHLQHKGIRTAIGSSSKNARFILARLALANAFDAVVDGTDISRAKPAPEVFVKAAELLAVEPRFCLVVEDSQSGLQAAIAAHMDCAAIGDGINYGIATYNLDTISDLLKIDGLG
ncbi:MAG TPA: beta-phosphoglucomutase [Syntrophomonadaceae bacterium]|nr:beta-phosphoglucomutase [Syntrophomonadaceae bacterium]